MADKVSWISFILKKHILESQLADAERGEKLQSHKCYNQIFVLQANAKRTHTVALVSSYLDEFFFELNISRENLSLNLFFLSVVQPV